MHLHDSSDDLATSSDRATFFCFYDAVFGRSVAQMMHDAKMAMFLMRDARMRRLEYSSNESACIRSFMEHLLFLFSFQLWFSIDTLRLI